MSAENTSDFGLAEPPPAAPASAGVRTFGLERWVQFGFVAVFLIAFWLFDNVITLVWVTYADPDSVVVSGLAALGAVVVAVALYKHPKANRFASESASELSKVTWPSRPETWQQTVVVVITSIVAAIVLFFFDALWSWLTDLIYVGAA